MVWAPSKAILTPRAIAVNLMAYFVANQADVLTWAGGTGFVPLRAYSTVASRVDKKPVFPMISFMEDTDLAVYGNDLIGAEYKAVFEVVIDNPDPAVAKANAEIYCKALVSMILNCPGASLVTNTGAVGQSITCQQIETNFDQIAEPKSKTMFYQVFQISADFTMSATGNI